MGYLSASKDGKAVWAVVNAYNTRDFSLTIVEKEAMRQDVLADAGAFASGIKEAGHVAVYGIYFDTGKSDVKPESDAALKEIARLLSQEAKLKLYVVGHTDSVGQLDANMKLSQARAEAVVKVLTTRHGVAAARLKAAGAGPIAPVASNATEEGRASNRRVELVEQ
jgi:OOP family OmpA-OmpF porin